MPASAETIGMVVKMHDELYYGHGGRKALTSRMDGQENATTDIRKQLRSLDAKFWAIILMLLGVGIEVATKGKL